MELIVIYVWLGMLTVGFYFLGHHLSHTQGALKEALDVILTKWRE